MSITPAAPQTQRKWTILVYSAGDNNLHDFLVTNLDDAEKVGSTDSVAVVSQLDHGGSAGAERLFIQKDNQPGLHSQQVEQLGDVDMASPDTLSEFVQWGMKNYPAEHTMVIISDHGNGWRGAVEDAGHGTWMKLEDIEEGLKKARTATGKPLDVLGFDACLMASAEVAHQLKDEAKYLVVSQEVEGGEGWPYTRVLSENLLSGLQAQLATRNNLDAREFAIYCVNAAASTPKVIPTISAIDSAQVPALTTAVKGFADAIVATPARTGQMRKAARGTQSFYDYKDLTDFAQRVANNPKIADANLKQAANSVTAAVSNAVIAERHSPSYPGAHGLTIELGNYFFSPNREYRDLGFSQQSGWDKALDRLGTYWFWPTPLTESAEAHH